MDASTTVRGHLYSTTEKSAVVDPTVGAVLCLTKEVGNISLVRGSIVNSAAVSQPVSAPTRIRGSRLVFLVGLEHAVR